MPQKLVALCLHLAELLTGGDLVEFASHHVYPCPFSIDDSYRVMADPEALVGHMARHRARWAARGVTRFECRVVAQEIPRGAHVRAWLQWDHHRADGETLPGGTTVIYFLRQPDGRLLVELVEVLPSVPVGAEAPSVPA